MTMMRTKMTSKKFVRVWWAWSGGVGGRGFGGGLFCRVLLASRGLCSCFPSPIYFLFLYKSCMIWEDYTIFWEGCGSGRVINNGVLVSCYRTVWLFVVFCIFFWGGCLDALLGWGSQSLYGGEHEVCMNAPASPSNFLLHFVTFIPTIPRHQTYLIIRKLQNN